MPVFIAALLGGLVSAAGSLVGRVLIAAGIGYVTFTGISTALGAVLSQVQGAFVGLPVIVLACAYLLKIDVLVSISMSAVAARLTLQGLTSGAVSRMVVKP